MGCDIHGCVEVKRTNWGWDYLLDIKPFLERNYGLFGSYFGVRNYYNFIPLFAFRGFPDRVDYKTKGEFYGEQEYYSDDFDEDSVDLGKIDHHSLTYATLKELNNIPDKIDYVKYALKGKTELEEGDGLGPLQFPIDWEGKIYALTDADYRKIQTGETVEKNLRGKDYWFKLDTIDFKKFIDNYPASFDGMRDLVRFMNLLKEKFDDVRMIVWFDN